MQSGPWVDSFISRMVGDGMQEACADQFPVSAQDGVVGPLLSAVSPSLPLIQCQCLSG